MPSPLPFVVAATLALAAPAAPPAPPEAPPPPAPPAAEEPAPDLSNFPWRHGQLQLHQVLGLATLGSMAATGTAGYWLSRQGGGSGVFDAHLLLAGLTTGLYLTSATLALTAPPPPIVREEGPWDTTAIHKKLAWLHEAGMIGTVGLGLLTNYQWLGLSNYHAIFGYTTIGLMALSAGVIAFGE